MNIWTVILTLAGIAGIAVITKSRSRRLRQKKLFSTPPPPTWLPILETTLPMIGHLSGELKRQLFGKMQVFFSEKTFEGCGGLEITEEIRVTVAAQACMLLLGRETKVYPKLKTILVYPHTYRGGQKGMFGGDNGDSARLGESWDCGVVVLSWDSVKGGARNFEDGHNVTFHEFAHQLDQEDGAADGAPILGERSAYATWAHVFNHEYDALVDLTRRGKKDTMDRYGATNPAEFFAVATETFFEKPHQLKTKHPELYEELQYYYKVDPLDWGGA
ncbi:MAG: hypothetical protein DRP64_07140 [Verrucomicrobia bacterium]|nr:MAG: hypothetical protein DRP64_07140 [Verrucomicrobiota bacterium]